MGQLDSSRQQQKLTVKLAYTGWKIKIIEITKGRDIQIMNTLFFLLFPQSHYHFNEVEKYQIIRTN